MDMHLLLTDALRGVALRRGTRIRVVPHGAAAELACGECLWVCLGSYVGYRAEVGATWGSLTDADAGSPADALRAAIERRLKLGAGVATALALKAVLLNLDAMPAASDDEVT